MYIKQDMATKEQMQAKKKIIEHHLKPVLAQYKTKGTLKIKNHQIILTLHKGKLNILADWCGTKYAVKPYFVNYELHSFWSNESLEFFKKTVKALASAGWWINENTAACLFDAYYDFEINVEDYKFIAD